MTGLSAPKPSDPGESPPVAAEVSTPENTGPATGAAAGLTSEEVRQRHAAGQSNHVDTATSRPLSVILRTNLFTVFNGILIVCVIAVLAVGDWRDSVFGIVLAMNLAIGIFSELRSKRTLDSLAVLNAPVTVAVRDGKPQEVPSGDLVLDDIIELKLGDQVPADGEILHSHGLRVDESALTGESKPVDKSPGDQMLSGTSVVAGQGTMVVQVIGADSWAQKLTTQAKHFVKAQSEIQGAIDQVLKWITLILPVIVIILLWSQVRGDNLDWRTAIIYTVAGVVGMIPQGLVLLTSMNFGMASATLARRGVLVQELPAVEILARVDVLCLDKTGTLTTGEIRGRRLIHSPTLEGDSSKQALTHRVLRSLVSDGTNATAVATMQMVENADVLDIPEDNTLPFNSSRKWAALVLPDDLYDQMRDRGLDGKTWVMGAPEIVLADSGDQDQWAWDAVSKDSSHGRRTVTLAYSPTSLEGENLPMPLQAALVVSLEEDVRPDAAETLQYFRDQGVRVKVISGDAPETVGSIAADLGLRAPTGEAPHVMDARKLPSTDSEEFGPTSYGYDVFGRVTPEQKRALVKALQHEGHVVAMTGDGVNDALALKDADLGIAMGNGASATKAVAKLVLMDGEFSVLPGVVAEGRRIIANMERVSSLFLSKTTYAILFALVAGIFGFAYPFLPRHLTYIGTFTIGVPAFFLALGPNTRRYRPGFLKRTLLIAVPSGLVLGLSALGVYLITGQDTLPGHTAATLTLIVGAMALLILLSRPWAAWKVVLVISMVAGAVLGLVISPVRNFFALEWPPPHLWLIVAIAGGIGAALVVVAYHITARWREEGRKDNGTTTNRHQSAGTVPAGDSGGAEGDPGSGTRTG